MSEHQSITRINIITWQGLIKSSLKCLWPTLVKSAAKYAGLQLNQVHHFSVDHTSQLMLIFFVCLVFTFHFVSDWQIKKHFFCSKFLKSSILTSPSERSAHILWLLFNWIDMLASCSMHTKLVMSIVATLCQLFHIYVNFLHFFTCQRGLMLCVQWTLFILNFIIQWNGWKLHFWSN